jgi:hypothetical protein
MGELADGEQLKSIQKVSSAYGLISPNIAIWITQQRSPMRRAWDIYIPVHGRPIRFRPVEQFS